MAISQTTVALTVLLPLAASAFAREAGAVGAARDLLDRGDYEQALAALVAEVERSEEARLLLAELKRRTGAYEEAISLLEGRGGEAGLRRAEILLEIGRLTEANEELRSLPRSPEGCLLLGRAHARQGETAKAREAWEAAIPFYEAMSAEEAQRVPAELFVTFGRCLAGLDRFEEANGVMLAQALEREKRSLAVLLFAGELFTAKYDFPEGRRYFRTAREIAPRHADPAAWLARATIDDPLAGGERLQAARDLAAEALAVNPRHEQALMILGDTYFFDGSLKAARESYLKALETNPSSLEALGAIYSCGHMAFDAEEKRSAEEKARRVSARPASFYLAASQRCETQCHYPAALDLASKAHEADPSYWPLYTALGLGHLRAGRYEQASRAVEEGLNRDPYNVWLHNTRLLLQHMRRSYTVDSWNKIAIHAPRETAPFYVNYIGPLLMEAYELFKDRYGFDPPAPVHVEVYPDQEYFATRTLGLPDFPAQGVCFGPVIAFTVQPAFPGNHALAAWHEFAHVFTVMGSDYRIPRWLTEGISVREEGLCPVGRKRSFLAAAGRAVACGKLPGLADFDQRFRRPRNPQEILTAYALSPLAVELLIERFGHGVLPRLIRSLRRADLEAAFREATSTPIAEFDQTFRARLVSLGAEAASEFAGEGLDVAELKARVKAGVKAGAASPRELADLAWAYLGEEKDIDAENLALRLRADASFPGDASSVLGLVACRNGRLSEAQKELRQALDQNTRNGHRVLLTLAAIAERRKDAAARAQALEEAWKRSPELSAEGGDAGPLGQLCRLWADSGDPRLQQALTDLVAWNREASWARSRLADLLAAAGDREGEFKILSELVYLIPFQRGTRLNAELFSRVADLAEKLGLPVEAERARKVLKAACGS